MILIDTQKEEFNKLKDIRIFEKMDNEKRYHGNLLVIGLGGVGSRIVCNMKGMLMGEITSEDNINYLMIDSDIPAMETMIEDSKDGIGLNATEIISIYRPNVENLLVEGIKNNKVHPNLANWMDEDFPDLNIDIDGAKGNRQLGRLMFSNAYEDVRMILFERLQEIYDKSDDGLDVIIVSGVSGGTGSGILADVCYNIRAYAKSKKWNDFRIGGCLVMPDVLYGNILIADDMEQMALMNANSYATLKEVDYYMHIAQKEETYVFESTTHRIAIRENIFDTCMLVSGKKDEQGYIPSGIIYNDVAYFLTKLATHRFMANTSKEDGKPMLPRDVFFENTDKGRYKVINTADYRVPIREIENICEHEVFVQAYKKLHEKQEVTLLDKEEKNIFAELNEFLEQKAGEEILLSVVGLIRMTQFEKPTYKLIKKNQDNLREDMAKQLRKFEEDVPIIIKAIKNKVFDLLDREIRDKMSKYGPYAVIDMIGAAHYGSENKTEDYGMIADVREMENKLKEYHPTGEFSRIIDSIKDIVSKRFFAFPNAKKETENGYYDACIKETLTLERSMLVDGFDAEDLFGDIIRWLRAKAERLDELYAQFDEDIKNAVEDLANEAKRITGFTLKTAKHKSYLPKDYVTEEKINEFYQGLVRLLVNNESNIDNGRLVQIRPEMERIYRNLLVGVGMYAPEKLIATAFADEIPSLQEINMMFVSSDNDDRTELMHRAATAFVDGTNEKSQKKKLCILKPGFRVNLVNKKYISLPAIMPHFSGAVKYILTNAPYREDANTITMNTGDVTISVDDMYLAVPLSMLACMDDMVRAYQAVLSTTYKGLHIDEVNIDMVKEFPEIA